MWRHGAVRRASTLGGSVGLFLGLHAAARDARPLRWVIVVVLVVAIGTAVWDLVLGTWGNAIVSAVYLFALMIEILWWPKRQKTLLDNANRAAQPRP